MLLDINHTLLQVCNNWFCGLKFLNGIRMLSAPPVVEVFLEEFKGQISYGI